MKPGQGAPLQAVAADSDELPGGRSRPSAVAAGGAALAPAARVGPVAPPAGGVARAAADAAARPRRSLRRRPGRWLKPLVFAASLAPLAWLVAAVVTGELGPNPVETLTDATGTLAIRFLLISLALTPLRWLLGDPWPVRLRRMLGLFAFFYAMLHLAIYVVLDRELDLGTVLEDVVERPYITAGLAAFLVLLPLALTSAKAIGRRLGGRRWQSLHRWVYVGAAAAVVHHVLLAKGDLIEPYVYLVILALLLGARLARQLGHNS